MVAKIAPLLVIVGETASGKSDLAMELARRFNGEIICADSRTIYKGMDIGTAKPSLEDRAEVPHHMLDIINPNERYSVVEFKTAAQKLIEEISLRGRLPILVGGTGLYIDAVIFNYQFSHTDAPRSKDNSRHLDSSVTVKKHDLRPNTLVLGMQVERTVLEERIKRRIAAMFDAGFEDEVKKLIELYGTNNEAMSGIGYRTMAKYVRGELTLDEAKDEFVRGDKSLAKRQRTWFKRNKSIHWIEKQIEAVDLVTTLLSKN